MTSVLCLLSLALLGLQTPVVSATNTPAAASVSPAPVALTNAPPAAIAPVWRMFSAKCADGTVTRTDLIVFKRFIATVALDDAVKKDWMDKARKLYRARRLSRNSPPLTE